MVKRGTIKAIIEIAIAAALFILFSYLVQKNLDFFEKFVINDVSGILIFMLIEITSIVIAPVTTLPLIAVASNLWGWVLTGVISIFAWTIGSWIAFVIARKYGVRIVRKFISLKSLYKIQKKVPHKHIFWSVVLLRLIIPVDILSYALGIFTNMKTRNYLLATIIGITPFAFVFAYLGTTHFKYQIIAFLVAFMIFLLGWLITRKVKRKRGKK